MAYRRRFIRRRRSRGRWIWARAVQGLYTALNTGPAVNQFDLLADFRQQFVTGSSGGLTLNLPDITIWRIHLKLSLTAKWSLATAPASNDGFHIAVYCNSIAEETAALTNYLTNKYSQQFLWWDYLYFNETWKNSTGYVTTASTTAIVPIYKEYDIKAHRKLVHMDDTLWLSVVSQGLDLVPNDLSFTYSILLRLPR